MYKYIYFSNFLYNDAIKTPRIACSYQNLEIFYLSGHGENDQTTETQLFADT
jgi:hypothetical protein